MASHSRAALLSTLFFDLFFDNSPRGFRFAASLEHGQIHGCPSKSWPLLIASFGVWQGMKLSTTSPHGMKSL